jgi:hypothetical protein
MRYSHRLLWLQTPAAFAGCGGASALTPLPSSVTDSRANSTHGSQRFFYSGHTQIFKVPAGVETLKVNASGAAGESAYASAAGGPGGLVVATI